jgi:ABC-type transport system involved in multi-copper enzyme maturation permease subunit
LTTLAIINFVLGGFQALGALISLTTINMVIEVNGQIQHADRSLVVVSVLLNVVVAALLITSGVGFLKTNRWSGWLAGNLYVLFFVARAIFSAATGVTESDPSTFSLVSFVYPLLIFLFVNFVFPDVWRERSGAQLIRGRGAPDAPHIVLIGQNAVRQTLRGASGVLFCFATLVIGLFLTQILFLPIDFFRLQAQGQQEISDEQLIEQLETISVPLLGRLIGANELGAFSQGEESGDSASPRFLSPTPLDGDLLEDAESPGIRWARYLLRDRPGFLSLILMVLCFFIPVVVVFSGFSQIAGDARNRGLRYLLLRTTRRDIFFGKFAGSVVVSALLIFLLMVAVTVYVQRKLNVYEFQAILPWALWGFIAFVLASLPFIAISITMSAMIDSPFGALAAGLGVVGVFPLIVRGIASAWGPFQYVGYLVPQQLVFSFFHPDTGRVVAVALAMVGYAALYLAGGYLYFKRRNL